MNNMHCKNKGITLVALIVTIIILLILTGITIAELIGHGLVKETKKTVNESKYENTTLNIFCKF